MSRKSVLFQHDWNQSKTEKLPRNSWTHFIGKTPVWKSKAKGCHEFGKLCKIAGEGNLFSILRDLSHIWKQGMGK